MTKPTKMRNRQIYKATNVVRSGQLAANLAENLRSKYKRRSIRVVEGDSVTVKRGEYKNITGKIEKIDTASGRVAIAGIKEEKTKGDKFDPMIHASNLLVTGLRLGDPRRRKKIGASDEHEAEYVKEGGASTAAAAATAAVATTTTTAAGRVEGRLDDDLDYVEPEDADMGDLDDEEDLEDIEPEDADIGDLDDEDEEDLEDIEPEDADMGDLDDEDEEDLEDIEPEDADMGDLDDDHERLQADKTEQNRPGGGS